MLLENPGLLQLLVVQLLQLDSDVGVVLEAAVGEVRVLELLQELRTEAAERTRLIRNLLRQQNIRICVKSPSRSRRYSRFHRGWQL